MLSILLCCAAVLGAPLERYPAGDDVDREKLEDLVEMTDPETPAIAWQPNSPPQVAFLASNAYEALYGGAAGGGKSDALLAGACRYAHLPGYKGIIFRRTFPDLKKTLIPRSRVMIPDAFGDNAKYNQQDKVWRFKGGGELYFGALEHENTVLDYRSAEFQYIGFDETSLFTEFQLRYMKSRGRSSTGIPVRIRYGTNPGGPGHPHLLRSFAPWLLQPGQKSDDVPDFAGPYAQAGQKLWWDPKNERWLTAPATDCLSRTFIPAKLSDNPALRNDPTYRAALLSQDVVTRAQLLDGNWLAKAAAGVLFKRSYFEIVDAAPADPMLQIRYWDRAATKPHDENKDPDWTRGVKVSRTKSGIYFIEHVASDRDRPHRIEQLVKNTAETDGHRCIVGIEQDPGAAGVAEADSYVRLLAGFNVRRYKPTGDKVTRAQPLSAQAEAGNVKLVRGAWNESFLAELEQFPTKGVHDDQVDGSSGGFNAISPSTGLARLQMLATL